MTCRRIRKRLSAFMDAELPAETMRRIHLHLNKCPACREKHAELLQMQACLLRNFGNRPVKEAFSSTVMQRIRQQSPPLRRPAMSRRWLSAAAYSGLFALCLILGLQLVPVSAAELRAQALKASWMEVIEQQAPLHLSRLQDHGILPIWNEAHETSE